MLKILFLASEPTDNSHLRLGQELRDIREKLQLSKARDTFSLVSRESVRPSDLSQAIFDVNPQIIHFSGHGFSSKGLCFEDSNGKGQFVQADSLASLFELIGEQVSCVILNACYSSLQAQAIADHVPFVIGMNSAISDEAAIIFAVGFYKALGAGCSFEEAYKFGCVELKLEGIPEYLTPILHANDQLYSKKAFIDISQPLQRHNTSTVTFNLIYTETGFECIVKAPSNIRITTCIERIIGKVAELSPKSKFLQNHDLYNWYFFARKGDTLMKGSPNLPLQSILIHSNTIELHAKIHKEFQHIQRIHIRVQPLEFMNRVAKNIMLKFVNFIKRLFSL